MSVLIFKGWVEPSLASFFTCMIFRFTSSAIPADFLIANIAVRPFDPCIAHLSASIGVTWPHNWTCCSTALLPFEPFLFLITVIMIRIEWSTKTYSIVTQLNHTFSVHYLFSLSYKRRSVMHGMTSQYQILVFSTYVGYISRPPPPQINLFTWR